MGANARPVEFTDQHVDLLEKAVNIANLLKAAIGVFLLVSAGAVWLNLALMANNYQIQSVARDQALSRTDLNKLIDDVRLIRETQLQMKEEFKLSYKGK